jgi:hypothetical protein
VSDARLAFLFRLSFLLILIANLLPSIEISTVLRIKKMLPSSLFHSLAFIVPRAYRSKYVLSQSISSFRVKFIIATEEFDY